MSRPFVEKLETKDSNVLIIGDNRGTITVQGLKQAALFVDVPAMPPRRLIGRDQALSDVRAQLRDRGSVALHGLPGSGKTALALALARSPETLAHFRGGVLWASLGSGADPANALGRWATALELGRDPGDAAGGDIRSLSLALQRRTRGEPLLVVVDDVWDWEQLRAFRELSLPSCAFLITTRDAELARRFAGAPSPVDTLTEAQSETFLDERCPGARAADALGLAELARAAGGLPLALALIAAELARRQGQARWMREAIGRLRDLDALLELEESELEAMPRSLRACVELSLTALPAAQLGAFEALGTFAPKPADFSRDAALAVWQVQGEQGDALLRSLLERGLLEIASEDRFALHQVLAHVAERRLGQPAAETQGVFCIDGLDGPSALTDLLMSGSVDGLGDAAPRAQVRGEIRFSFGGADDPDVGPWQRHWGYYIGLVMEQAFRDPPDWPRIERDLQQVQHAFRRMASQPRAGLTIFHACQVSVVKRAVADEQVGPAVVKWILSFEPGLVTHALRDTQREARFYERGGMQLRTIGDRAGEAQALYRLASLQVALGDLARAKDTCEQAVTLLRAGGDRGLLPAAVHSLGEICGALGDTPRQLECLDEVVAQLGALGDRRQEADALHNTGNVLRGAGDLGRALQRYEQALAIRRAMGDAAREVDALRAIGNLHVERRDPGAARDAYQQAASILKAGGQLVSLADTLCQVANTYAEAGDPGQQRVHYEQALAAVGAAGDRGREAELLYKLGLLRAESGDHAGALAQLEQALDVWRELGDTARVASALNDVGVVYGMSGDQAGALQRYRDALPLLRAAGNRDDEARTLANILRAGGTLDDAEMLVLAEGVVAQHEAEHNPKLPESRRLLASLRAQQRSAAARPRRRALLVLVGGILAGLAWVLWGR